MSTQHPSDSGTETLEQFETRWPWKGGAVAGVSATVMMGIVISLTDLAMLREAIAGLYGFQGSLVAGWGAHLFHGTLFGIIFAGFLADPGLYRVSDWLWKTVVASVVYGVVLSVVGAGIIMPIWLGLVGFPTPPSIPYVTVPILVWHLVYGIVLGTLFWYLDGL